VKWTEGKELVFFTFSNSYSMQFWLWGITRLLIYFWTLPILWDPTDRATLSQWERKPDRSWIYRDSQFTCIVQLLTVILSHISQLVYFASLPLQSPITTLLHLFVCLFIIHSVDPHVLNKPTQYRGCQENTNRI
jgi:hypothetical protein